MNLVDFGDPLYRLPRRWRIAGYLWLSMFFLRLVAWHGLDEAFGEP